MWTRWKQREENEGNVSEQTCFSKSFAYHMAEIGGEINRILKREKKLERIQNNLDYIGEPQVIRHIFEMMKKNPENMVFMAEIEQAERKTFAFLSGEPDAPTAREMDDYWRKHLQAYITEF